ncbi:MAG: SDR family oxidoreductase [Gemmatimonadetes bacterium]|nr:SDR family oxidoreductase [Gemmatimonadota bacterium]MBT8478705.1 SDR family oxidoreductase [Gemmatimonadota bacterium]
MENAPSGQNEWALILGGSSGFGLATAHKLSEHGLNLCVVHRDRRGAMSRIEPEFEQIRERGVALVTFNQDALADDSRAGILDDLAERLAADGGRVRLLLHSIAFGNLKLIGPEAPTDGGARETLARELGIEEDFLAEVADRTFAEGVDGVQGLTSPPAYAQDLFLEDEDMVRTIYAMGTSLLTWTQDILQRGLFAPDARVLGMTSEGNQVAWKGYAAVAAAKVALESVSRSIAVEMAHFGIRSNIVQAGVTDTPALRLIPGSDHLKAQARARNPFGRLTTPEDVANVIYLLSLPEAAWINGAIIRVDGGEHISGLTR